MNGAFVIAAKRTAIGRIGGLHRRRDLPALAGPLLAALLAETAIEGGDVDEVILGNAAGGGGNPARLVALAAGLPERVPGISIDRQCASGLDAVLTGARLIGSGAARIVIAGGAESPSTAPWRVAKPASLYSGLPRFFDQARFTPEAHNDPTMVEAAEAVARDFGITRAAQDDFALRSHRLAAAATDAGEFADEIVPLGGDAAEPRDEGVRHDLTAAVLARMPPLLPGGSVTAGNTCRINDGAALVLLVAEDVWRALGAPPALRVIAGAAAGVKPIHLGTGPVPALRRLMALVPGFAPGAVDAVEFNEAFASQVLASLTLLEIPFDKVNTGGGALAFGHPYGASGAVLVARLFTRLVRNRQRTEGRRGLALVGAAGGLGVAALFEATG